MQILLSLECGGTNLLVSQVVLAATEGAGLPPNLFPFGQVLLNYLSCMNFQLPQSSSVST